MLLRREWDHRRLANLRLDLSQRVVRIPERCGRIFSFTVSAAQK